MPCRADTTIEEEVFHQIETSKACGTWIFKKDIEEAALRHLKRMAIECGISGDMHALVSEIERKEGKSFSELLATSPNAIWHDPSLTPQTDEERKQASEPLVFLGHVQKQQEDLYSILTGAIYTFLRDYRNQATLNKHFEQDAEQHTWVKSRIESVRKRLSHKARPSLVKKLEDGLGIGPNQDASQWPDKLKSLTVPFAEEPTLDILRRKATGDDDIEVDPPGYRYSDLGVPVSQRVQEAGLQRFVKKDGAYDTTSLVLQRGSRFQSSEPAPSSADNSITVFCLGTLTSYEREKGKHAGEEARRLWGHWHDPPS